MKLSSLLWGLLLGAVANAVAQGEEEDDYDEIPADYSQETTVFDGKKVPPVLELTPDNFDKEIKASKYMLVKLYRCVDSRLRNALPFLLGMLTRQQPVLPSLSGLRAGFPNLVRILLHRGDARPFQVIHRVLSLAVRNDQLHCLCRPMQQE